jgi:hypothetical protein
MVRDMLFPMSNVLYFYISTFRRKYAVPNISVVCKSMVSRFPCVLLGCFLNVFEKVSVVFIITGIGFVLHGTCYVFSIIIIIIIIIIVKKSFL